MPSWFCPDPVQTCRTCNRQKKVWEFPQVQLKQWYWKRLKHCRECVKRGKVRA